MLDWLFHRHKPSWVFRDAAGTYQRCLSCGARLSAAIDFTPTHRFPERTGIEQHFAEEIDVVTLLEREK